MAKNKTSVQNNLERHRIGSKMPSRDELDSVEKQDEKERKFPTSINEVGADGYAQNKVRAPLPKDKYSMTDMQKFIKNFNTPVSKRAFLIAFIVSLSWVFISFTLLLDRDTMAGITEFLTFENGVTTRTRLAFVNLFSLIFFPLCFFWSLAIIVYRTQEARQVTKVIVQAAVMISQPQKMAKDAMTSLSGFVRQEVKLMDSSIERALEKVSQLQSIVQEELDKLNRSYSEQKSTLSILLHDLSTERETMLKTVQDLRQQTIDAYEPIVKENDKIENLIALSTQRVTELSNSLKDNVSFFEEASSKIFDNLQHNNDLFSNTSEKLNWIYQDSNEKFGHTLGVIDDQTTQLTQAANALTEANEKIDKMLQERHDNLANMLTKVDRQADAMLTNINQSVENLVEGVTLSEEKVNQFSQVIRYNSVEDVKQALDGFAQISNRIEVEGNKIRSKMKDDYSATLNDIWNKCEQTSQTINKNISQMHDVASVALNEVSQTRKKLDEAIHELPRETARTSKSLKLAVDGHIKTLRDLAQEAGKTFSHLENAKTETISSHYSSDYPYDGQANRQTTRPSNATQSKWGLNDLITNAKKAEQKNEPVTPQYSNVAKKKSIGNFSWNEADMVRAFNVSDLEQLWMRHNNGEKNVFTEMLYTREGLSLFKEIQSRYKYDTSFREEVDSYLDEFETLLFSAHNSDRHQMLLKTYLTSETGKIYLLLAHASGRLH